MQRRNEDFTSGLTEGYAEPEATEDYFKETRKSCPEYKDDFWFQRQRNGLALSRLGYGAYRTQSGVRTHFDALREAFLLGTNVVDTAANYGDGESEQLVGDVIRELMEVKRLKRQNVAVVTKIGYVQGRNLELLRKIPIPDNVEIREDLWHCIHPDFLKAQIQLSRYRLGLKTIDYLLLHNPEEFLLQAHISGIPREEARAEYNRRLEQAFGALEFLVERGAIRYYGISSNTLAASADDFSSTHLDEVLPLAGPHFQAVQFPANLVETDFRYNRSASGGALAKAAEQAGLWTMGNRPLNAAGPRGLVRLARMVEEPPDGGDSIIAEFLHMQGRLTELEVRVREELYDFDFDREHPSFSYVLEKSRDEFSSREHLKQTLPDLLKPLEGTIRRMQTRAVTERGKMAFARYVQMVNAACHHWTRYTDALTHQKMEELDLSLTHPALAGQPLAVKSVLWLLSGAVPASVLCGMRSQRYVQQLSRVYGICPPDEADALSILTGASQALDKF